MAFLLLFIIPFVVAFATFLLGKHRVTLGEFGAHAFASIVVAGVSCAIIYHSNVADTETWNGSVTGKASVRVSCSHSYCCQWCQRCSGSGKNRSCHSYCCRTCYDHPYDVDWDVRTTIGTININRIDRQGVNEPPRWTRVFTGEPVSRSKGYTNYIKAAPDSLFRDQGLIEKYQAKLPEYPGDIYDYYRIDRLVSVGVKVHEAKRWNEFLSEVNARVGAPKQANIIVVMTTEDEKFYYALRQHWLGGKKNDIVVVMGVDPTGRPQHPKIEWARVMSWAQDDIFHVKLRDDLLNIAGFAEPERVLPIVELNVVEYFRRKPMADFEYLESSITPTVTQLVIALLINTLVSIGIAIFVVKNDFDSPIGRFGRRSYGR